MGEEKKAMFNKMSHQNKLSNMKLFITEYLNISNNKASTPKSPDGKIDCFSMFISIKGPLLY